MKETIQDLITRRSCKKYKPEQIREEELSVILEAGTYAPNGRGAQSALIVVIQDKETIQAVSKLNAEVAGSNGDPFHGAPTLVVVFADQKVKTHREDGAMVLGNLLNAAHAVGVDSCFIYRAREVFEMPEGKALMSKWGVPEDHVGIGNCILGYGAEGGTAPAAARKPGYILRV